MTLSTGTVFLTGFPRQTTRLALRNFQEEGRRVFLLSPPEFAEDAKEALGKEDGLVLTGRCDALDLGLSGTEVRMLQQEVEEVHHMEDSYHGSPAKMRHVLINGTRSLLEFALDLPRLARFIHYSSLYSSGWKRGLIIANSPNNAAPRWHNTYEKVRWEGERWARSAMQQIPLTIIRSGLVTGTADTPLDSTERSYHLLRRFIHRSLQIPLPLPDGGRHPLHLCPTDHLLSVAAGLVRHSGSIGATFHVTDPTPPSGNEVLTALGGRLPAEESPLTNAISSFISRLPGASPPPGAIQAYISQEIWYELGSMRATLEGEILPCTPFMTYADSLQAALNIRGKMKDGSRAN